MKEEVKLGVGAGAPAHAPEPQSESKTPRRASDPIALCPATSTFEMEVCTGFYSVVAVSYVLCSVGKAHGAVSGGYWHSFPFNNVSSLLHLSQVEHTLECKACDAVSAHRAVYSNMSLDFPDGHRYSCSAATASPRLYGSSEHS